MTAPAAQYAPMPVMTVRSWDEEGIDGFREALGGEVWPGFTSVSRRLFEACVILRAGLRELRRFEFCRVRFGAGDIFGEASIETSQRSLI